VPPILPLCRGCDQYVKPGTPDCPFCGANLAEAQRDYDERMAEVRAATAELQRALATDIAQDSPDQ
jgi:hypothetical protein